MSKPFFTVIIPTYNREKLLPRAIESVLAQTEQDFEIIITDDASTDSTQSLMEKIVRGESRIKYIRHAHTGVGESKNIALPFANGKYITFLGDDDEYLPTHLAIRKSILEEDSDIELLHGGIKVVGNEYVPDKNNPHKMIHVNKVVTGGTFFARSDVFKKIGNFPKKNFANDTEFYENAIRGGLKVIKIEDPTYLYYRLEDSITVNESNRIKTKIEA